MTVGDVRKFGAVTAVYAGKDRDGADVWRTDVWAAFDWSDFPKATVKDKNNG